MNFVKAKQFFGINNSMYDIRVRNLTKFNKFDITHPINEHIFKHFKQIKRTHGLGLGINKFSQIMLVKQECIPNIVYTYIYKPKIITQSK